MAAREGGVPRRVRARVQWDGRWGVWYARPYLGTNRSTGKPMRPYKSWPGSMTEEEAQRACDRWAEGLSPHAGLHVGRTIGDVCGSYIDHLELLGRAEGTVRAYRSLRRRYVDPALADVGVDEANPYVIEGAYAALMLGGGRNGCGVSARTVAQFHWFLSGMFRWAVRMGITASNPMPSVERPRFDAREAVAYDAGQMRALSDALMAAIGSGGSGRRAVFRRNAAMAAYLSLHTGARCGECLALTRAKSIMRADRCVRVDATVVAGSGGVHVQPFTKGKRGRTLSVTDANLEVMREHAAWQDASYLRHPGSHLTLCCDDLGRPLRPSSVSASFSALRDDLGLPKGTSFHTLRHTHATWLIANGVDVRTVQERLGHAKIATTLELYAHVLPGRDAQAAESFGRAVGDGS